MRGLQRHTLEIGNTTDSYGWSEAARSLVSIHDPWNQLVVLSVDKREVREIE